MIMINIYVARHGQDVDNANGILNGHRNQPLTDLGRQQAREVANRMLQEGFRLLSPSQNTPDSSSTIPITSLRAIYSSPLQRARETAEIFAGVLSSEGHGKSSESGNIHLLDALLERNFGIMTGMPTSSISRNVGRSTFLVQIGLTTF
jgi:probable phosphoglycerate mutase